MRPASRQRSRAPTGCDAARRLSHRMSSGRRRWASSALRNRHLLLGDRPVVQAEAHAVEMHAGDQRQLVPIEVELHHRRFASDAQVLTRVGRSETPDSSTKTISRPSRLAFFLEPARCACATARWRRHRAPRRAGPASGWTSPTAPATARRGPRCIARRTRARSTSAHA